MVYDWDGKEQTCRRLYVDEKQSLDEVMEYFRNEGFAPSYVASSVPSPLRPCILPASTPVTFRLGVNRLVFLSLMVVADSMM